MGAGGAISGRIRAGQDVAVTVDGVYTGGARVGLLPRS